MKTKPLMNFADSVRARLLAIAKKENIQLEYLLLRYALERFLIVWASQDIPISLF
jgi:hypothetical protein